jgi:hypothetical protein
MSAQSTAVLLELVLGWMPRQRLWPAREMQPHLTKLRRLATGWRSPVALWWVTENADNGEDLLERSALLQRKEGHGFVGWGGHLVWKQVRRVPFNYMTEYLLCCSATKEVLLPLVHR